MAVLQISFSSRGGRNLNWPGGRKGKPQREMRIAVIRSIIRNAAMHHQTRHPRSAYGSNCKAGIAFLNQWGHTIKLIGLILIRVQYCEIQVPGCVHPGDEDRDRSGTFGQYRGQDF